LVIDQDAYDEFAEFSYDRLASGLECGFGLFGAWDGARNRLLIDRITPNLDWPDHPNETFIDFDLFADLDQPGARLLGDAHSHPRGRVLPSHLDEDLWRERARALPEKLPVDVAPFWLGIVLTGEPYWAEGYPATDWGRPRMHASMITRFGHVYQRPHSFQPSFITRRERANAFFESQSQETM
jgi:hypothetical protein